MRTKCEWFFSYISLIRPTFAANKNKNRNMNQKGFLLGLAVCLAAVAYGKADTGMESAEEEGKVYR